MPLSPLNGKSGQCGNFRQCRKVPFRGFRGRENEELRMKNEKT
jgi:hypothetical protein